MKLMTRAGLTLFTPRVLGRTLDVGFSQVAVPQKQVERSVKPAFRFRRAH